jgi:hypothetical protein
MNNHDQHYYRILSQIEAGQPLTQRSLARDLGIALGLANLLVKRLANKGYIKTLGALNGKGIRYLLTTRGIAEKTRLSLVYLENTIERYAEARDRIRNRFSQIPVPTASGGMRPRLVFYGTGEIAEIAYVVANHFSFQLVGIVDDGCHQQHFLGYSIASPEQLVEVNGLPDYDHLVVTALSNRGDIEARLKRMNVPAEKVCFL